MDYTFRVHDEDDLVEAIRYAREYAAKDGNVAWLAFGEDGLKPEIVDDDYLNIEGKHGNVFLPPEDFTPEIMFFLIQKRPELVTKEVLTLALSSFISELDKAKD